MRFMRCFLFIVAVIFFIDLSASQSTMQVVNFELMPNKTKERKERFNIDEQGMLVSMNTPSKYELSLEHLNLLKKDWEQDGREFVNEFTMQTEAGKRSGLYIRGFIQYIMPETSNSSSSIGTSCTLKNRVLTNINKAIQTKNQSAKAVTKAVIYGFDLYFIDSTGKIQKHQEKDQAIWYDIEKCVKTQTLFTLQKNGMESLLHIEKTCNHQQELEAWCEQYGLECPEQKKESVNIQQLLDNSQLPMNPRTESTIQAAQKKATQKDEDKYSEKSAQFWQKKSIVYGGIFIACLAAIIIYAHKMDKMDFMYKFLS